MALLAGLCLISLYKHPPHLVGSLWEANWVALSWGRLGLFEQLGVLPWKRPFSFPPETSVLWFFSASVFPQALCLDVHMFVFLHLHCFGQRNTVLSFVVLNRTQRTLKRYNFSVISIISWENIQPCPGRLQLWSILQSKSILAKQYFHNESREDHRSTRFELHRRTFKKGD